MSGLDQRPCYGSKTALMTWITPLLAGMLAATIVAPKGLDVVRPDFGVI
ncbi:MAG: hypothetical protein ABI573_11375 [Chloroflexota bacterium]